MRGERLGRLLPIRAAPLFAALSLTLAFPALAQYPHPLPAQAETVVPAIQYSTAQFGVTLRGDTQTLVGLSPISDRTFDFAPSDREAERQGDGYVHLGDLHMRLRLPGGDWRDFSSAHQRQPIQPLAASPGIIAVANITATLGTGLPIKVERRWLDDHGALVLRFTLTNNAAQPVEIGGLGVPLVFNNILSGRSLDEAHAKASFVDPYIGMDGGYAQVTRLNGTGPALLVLPERGAPLEAWRPIESAKRAALGDIFTDRGDRAQTSEGFYDWTVASLGFAQKEWAKAPWQWNQPTSFTLAPGETRSFGLKFVLSPSIRAIDSTLAAEHRPVAVGIPGYVVPSDLPATLFLKAPLPVARVESWPDGALTPERLADVSGWLRYRITGKRWGPARLTITYADGSVQTVHYFVTKPLEQVMADLGRFTTHREWFAEPRDPFHRAPAILTYDREANRIVTRDHRVWISGMSDEGGAGAWVAAMVKQLDNPDPQEVARLERLVNETVWGKLQVASGPHIGAVKKSLFYYDPKRFPTYYDKGQDWSTWSSWKKDQADSSERSYNYPHVAVGYWVLYCLARNHVGLVRQHPWHWYLHHAFLTAKAMARDAPEYAAFGQMEGEVFLEILKDLQRESMTAEATEMQRIMKKRADRWASLGYPFESEMAWDSTGQPEVYAWMRYFGHEKQAAATREVILGYDPAIPSWGYNGNARRYWDFLYAGKYPRIERQIHHYGSALNAVPLFDAFRANPSDLHLLQVAYGGWVGSITNIDRDGFGSAAFHSSPGMMRWDPYSGDYGMGLFGHAYAAATYLIDHPQFGWLGFGGEVAQDDGAVTIVPRDGARSRLFIAPAGLWLTLDSGKIRSARFDPKTGRVNLTLDPADQFTPVARLRIERTLKSVRDYFPSLRLPSMRGAYVKRLEKSPIVLELLPR
jgi:hypothetical protein